jgi:phage terminase large subunit GpA-like protein
MSAWRTAFMNGLRPDPPLTVSEWADGNRRLSSKASAEPGPWLCDCPCARADAAGAANG